MRIFLLSIIVLRSSEKVNAVLMNENMWHDILVGSSGALIPPVQVVCGALNFMADDDG